MADLQYENNNHDYNRKRYNITVYNILIYNSNNNLDELGACRASLVSQQQFVLSVPVGSTDTAVLTDLQCVISVPN